MLYAKSALLIMIVIASLATLNEVIDRQHPQVDLLVVPSEIQMTCGHEGEFEVEIQNRGWKDVRVMACKTSCECTTPVALPVVVHSRKSERIRFHVKASDFPADLTLELTFFTDPPVPNLKTAAVIFISRPEAHQP